MLGPAPLDSPAMRHYHRGFATEGRSVEWLTRHPYERAPKPPPQPARTVTVRAPRPPREGRGNIPRGRTDRARGGGDCFV